MKTVITFIKDHDDLLEVDMEEEVMSVVAKHGYELQGQGYNRNTHIRDIEYKNTDHIVVSGLNLTEEKVSIERLARIAKGDHT